MTTLLEDARRRLHSQGGRMTAQRRAILEMLECLGCHPTAEELYESVRQRDPSINLSTVYRTLRWLEQEGLVSTRRFAENRRQERFDPALPSEHYHFVCRACGLVTEFDTPLVESISEHFELQSGYQVEQASLALYGLCADCQET